MQNIILFLLGLTIFLLGLYILKAGLEGLSSLNLKKVITGFTSTPFLGCLTGTFLTMLLQSSSAITVITIGLVDTGIMSFAQATGIILGTNIGTTITGQIMAYKLENLGLPIFILGLILFFFRNTIRFIGINLCGLGLIFMGMDYMGKSFLFIQNNPLFYHLLILTNKSNFLAIIFGIIFTAIIQSSSAMTGIVLVLAKNGQLNLITATAIILGSNVGTCITAVLASIGSTTGGKRVATAHVMLNLIGVIAYYPFLKEFTDYMVLTSTDLPRQIAHTHTVFNIISSVVILPFIGPFTKFICYLMPEAHR